MEPFPATPGLDDAPADLFETGHIWLQEFVVGAPLRFRVTDAGLAFGDERREFEQWAEPAGYRFAVREVREQFDEDAFRSAVEVPDAYTFFGVATRHEGLDYDWARLPGFLGVDLHAPDKGFRPPDVAEQAFERLGLAPVNAIAKELATRDFRPDRYAFPSSEWYDGPVAGVLVRNKRGGRAVIENAAVEPTKPETLAPETLVEQYLTEGRIDRIATDLGDSASVDTVLDRLVDELVREHYASLGDSVDAGAVRSAAAESVARRLGQ
ncbi:hypothetical protein [Halorarius litoreus]|uniref:hypothetical protein n=1 Tax=Halorarius litoreus TaxID=2962676 RepID=UPI0020CC7CAD|nr:hypothetical protein [Halorarius litoreus]